MVWAGPVPADDRAAAQVAAARMTESGSREPRPPSPEIRRYVDALLSRWADLTDLADDDVDDSPWADGPLIANADGDQIHFALVWSRAEEAAEFAARTAAEHGLVCFDPQSERLLPDRPAGPRGSRWRRLLGRG